MYIMSNRPNGTLYVAVTSDLTARTRQHQSGFGSILTSRYKLHRLVYYEPHPDITDAIRRETAVKRWPRAWKVRLINAANPEWNDLSMDLP
nr:GIY-YIG nuclease family protein [uncultured Rhodopila sp.]